MKLQGRRACITGGAQGIGLAIAHALAARGCHLVLADIDPSALEAAADSLADLAVDVEVITLDVTDAEAVRAMPQRVGEIDLLVNNAGTVHGGSFLDVDPDIHARVIGVNLEALVRVTHALLPGLIARPESMIVNLASAAGFVGLPFAGSYAGTKWGVIGFGETIRLELKELGQSQVRVMHVCPGYVDTALFRGVSVLRSTRLLNPTRLARKVVRGIERNRIWVRSPFLVAITPTLRALMPTVMVDQVLRIFGASRSMKGWRGRLDD